MFVKLLPSSRCVWWWSHRCCTY